MVCGEEIASESTQKWQDNGRTVLSMDGCALPLFALRALGQLAFGSAHSGCEEHHTSQLASATANQRCITDA